MNNTLIPDEIKYLDVLLLYKNLTQNLHHKRKIKSANV